MSNEEPISKRPKETQFHQQTLQAWNPLILMDTVFPFFAGIGIAFILIGVSLLMLSLSVKEVKVDYTDCKEDNGLNKPERTCSSVISNNATSFSEKCTCIVPFKIKNRFEGQVYLYYMIQNLYQNHRRYVKSKDGSQLLGRKVSKVTTDCDPYGSVQNGSIYLNYAPCGIIANSLFNDSFYLDYLHNNISYPVPMTNKGIAWRVDTNILYGQPKDWDNTLKPVNWAKSALERNNNSYKGDEELLVWMRTAPFSDFKKLNRIIKHDTDPFKGGLPSGDYVLRIDYAYPVTIFKGKKSMVLSTTNAMGGKNNNMGIMYLVVGIFQIIIAIVFALSSIFKKDSNIFRDNGKKEIKMNLMKTDCHKALFFRHTSDYMPVNT